MLIVDKGFSITNTEARWLLEQIEAQQQEIEQLVELNDLNILKMSMENGEIDMTIESPKAKLFFSSIVQAFRQNFAENYITIDVEDQRTKERYSLTIQKNDGASPAQQLDEKDKQIKSLTAEKDELVKVLKQARDILKEIHEHTSCDSVQNGYNACLVMAMAHKGLVKIDGAIGGKENV